MDTVSRDAAPVIVGDGHAETAWRASPWLRAVPRRDAATWLADVSRLVIVSPHPDDETLGCGGLIAEAAALGIPVLVVSVTDGEACYVDDPHWPAAHTRTVRCGELQAALRRLGVGEGSVIRLDLGDGQIGARQAELEVRLTAILASTDTVLSTWRLDGHPDHEACARAVDRVAGATGAHHVEYPVWAWHWIDPARGHPQLQGAVACRLSPAARAAKRLALGEFESQHARNGGAPILPPQVMERFERDFELVLP